VTVLVRAHDHNIGGQEASVPHGFLPGRTFPRKFKTGVFPQEASDPLTHQDLFVY
jgi:hypothetical protein